MKTNYLTNGNYSPPSYLSFPRRREPIANNLSWLFLRKVEIGSRLRGNDTEEAGMTQRGDNDIEEE